MVAMKQKYWPTCLHFNSCLQLGNAATMGQGHWATSYNLDCQEEGCACIIEQQFVQTVSLMSKHWKDAVIKTSALMVVGCLSKETEKADPRCS